MSELKECPFCGSVNVDIYESLNYSRYYKDGDGYFVTVKCNTCGAQSRGVWGLELPSGNNWNTPAVHNAVALWNARAIPQRIKKTAKPINAD